MKSWNEIRKAATAFSKRWKNAYDEKSHAQSFLKEFFAVAALALVASGAEAPARLVMDSNVNRFDPNPSRFSDFRHVRACGFNATAVQPGMPAAVTALFYKYDPRVFPAGSEGRAWVEAARARFAERYRAAKSAGLLTLAMTDIIVLPRRMKELYGDEICGADGRIDFMKPRTQEIYRALLGELFDTFPELDGLVVRTGETYTFNIPHHGGNGPVDYKKDLEGSKAVHAALMNLLREELCVKRGKICVYRTWDFGYFHVRPGYYLDVTGRVEPHPNLIVSVKHVAADFYRGVDFNRTLGLGAHRQIVEVQCQREYEGKGALPSYIASSVIDGFEEHEGTPSPHTLRDFAKSPLFAGVWTWSRGGGWVGPYIKNEIWCELNARVMALWAADPARGEEPAFDEASAAMGVMPESRGAFRRLALLSPKAMLRGKSATCAETRKGLPVNWTRDQFLGGLGHLEKYLRARIADGTVESVLADRREAVKMWEEMVRLAGEVRCRDERDAHYVLTSAMYGLRLYRMVEAGWDVMATGLAGRDPARLAEGVRRYDRAKAEYMALPKERADSATLYSDDSVRIDVSKAAANPVPGLGAAVRAFARGDVRQK